MTVTFHQIADALVGCIQAQLDPPADVACVVVGQISWDACQCGQLAVSVGRVWESQQFPADPGSAPPGTGTACGAPYLVADLTVQVLRCVAADEPTCDDLTSAHQQALNDTSAILVGVGCCMAPLWRTDDVTDWQTGPVTIQGPLGGCVGPEAHVQVGIVNPCGDCP